MYRFREKYAFIFSAKSWYFAVSRYHRHPAPPASILSFLFKSLSKSPQAPDVVLANFPYELLVLKTKEVEKVGCTASDSKDF